MEPKTKPPKMRPLPVDFEAARKEWEAEHAESFDSLPVRKRNKLAEDQMYHREYAELSKAITRR